MTTPIRPKTQVPGVVDVYARRNFENIEKFLGDIPLFGFVFLDFLLEKAETNKKFAHGLNYAPKDVVILRQVGSGTFTLNYTLFDDQFIDVTSTGPVRIRCFVGSYTLAQNNVNDPEGS